MTSLKNFIYALIALTGIPTWVMVVHPYAAERSRTPVAYDSVDDPMNPAKAVDPADYKGLAYPPVPGEHPGVAVYAREGCAQCHTQLVRADYAGIDSFRRESAKKGVGEDDIVVMRQTSPWDYLGENFAMIGQRRVGPDFANATYRFGWSKNDKGEWKQDRTAAFHQIYNHLYSPRAIHDWSICPPMPHLFTEQKKESEAGTANAVTLPPNLAPDAGIEIVPTRDAENLAGYLLSLQRDHAIPNSLAGIKTKKK